jgi:HPr kinase/phosphorylase
VDPTLARMDTADGTSPGRGPRPKPPPLRVPPGVPVSAVAEHFGAEILSSGGHNLSTRLIVSARLSRPGIEWSDVSGQFPASRAMVFGNQEWSYFQGLTQPERATWLRRFAELDVPVVIVTRGLPIDEGDAGVAQRQGLPILRTAAPTTDFAGDLNWFLQLELAPRALMHAGLVDVLGEGVLILGRSGIGKSETALELIRRGHQLIADDTVELRRPTEHELIGRAPGRMRHFMEVKGIGIVNLRTMYGIGAVRSSGDVVMAVSLVPEDPNLEFTTGPDRMEVLGVDLPLVTIPLRPGRNAAVLIEAAATMLRARRLGGADERETQFEHRTEIFGRLR